MPANPTNNVFGVYPKNNNTSGYNTLPTEENDPTIPFSMFLMHNTFNNGTASLMLLNYTSSYLPYYVKSNTFNSASVLGILGRNMTGTIKDNIISNSGAAIPMGIHLIASSPDLYNNTIISENVSLHTIGSSYPNLKPLVSGSNLSWTGGKNRFTSIQSDNIQLVNSGNVYTKLGENRFNISDTSSNRYHIYGWVDTSMHKYSGNNNCWYSGGNPRIYLRRNYTNEPIITETGITNIDCNREIEPNSWVVNFLGSTVYDSVKQSADTAGSNLTAEQQLYIQGQNYLNASMFTEGISTLKDLTDTYNYFEDLPASVYDLYSCYESLDTNSDQNYRNTLYGNLKIYLDDKINNGDFDAEFISNAYNVSVMCDANMENYDDAANAYEFIALFHPDPDIRLNASWDYAEIEALMGGGNGGGERQLQVSSDKLKVEELRETNEIKRMNEIISNDPVMSKMKETYEKISKQRLERNERTEKQINESIKTNEKIIEKSNEINNEISKENIIKSEQLQKLIQIQTESDKIINEKAKRNLFELKNLNKPELEKRRIEDMFLSAKDLRNTSDVKSQTLNIPLEFKLNQNYPNPFNPVTKISYELRVTNYVSVIVYNVLGKEVKTLVNQKQNAGRYEVEFDGSNLSSGVYFYKLVTNDFTAVKRMVLLK